MEAARSECEGDGASDVEALFASQEEAKPPNILAAGTGLKKVQVACSEQEGVGSPDEEALFASQEGVKRSTVLATGTGLKKSAGGSLRTRRR
ncbi:hypothetical protein KQ3_04363 [Bacillus cereus B5-2]|nr:hypothetical protein ICS_00514 [Bacillus cereus BAG2O-3]EOQ07761.1 hypothetical protein KQ3_04363 [Bacillus cereus B5-2]RFB41818.1 hypothetical protein DZB83_28285 [Bacillus sp. dmp10]